MHVCLLIALFMFAQKPVYVCDWKLVHVLTNMGLNVFLGLNVRVDVCLCICKL